MTHCMEYSRVLFSFDISHLFRRVGTISCLREVHVYVWWIIWVISLAFYCVKHHWATAFICARLLMCNKKVTLPQFVVPRVSTSPLIGEIRRSWVLQCHQTMILVKATNRRNARENRKRIHRNATGMRGTWADWPNANSGRGARLSRRSLIGSQLVHHIKTQNK